MYLKEPALYLHDTKNIWQCWDTTHYRSSINNKLTFFHLIFAVLWCQATIKHIWLLWLVLFYSTLIIMACSMHTVSGEEYKAYLWSTAEKRGAQFVSKLYINLECSILLRDIINVPPFICKCPGCYIYKSPHAFVYHPVYLWITTVTCTQISHHS